jgi:hypothetical protein
MRRQQLSRGWPAVGDSHQRRPHAAPAWYWPGGQASLRAWGSVREHDETARRAIFVWTSRAVTAPLPSPVNLAGSSVIYPTNILSAYYCLPTIPPFLFLNRPPVCCALFHRRPRNHSTIGPRPRHSAPSTVCCPAPTRPQLPTRHIPLVPLRVSIASYSTPAPP